MFPGPSDCVDLHGIFTLVLIRYTSMGSSSGWAMAVQVGWAMAVQVRGAVISQGSGYN